MPPDRLTAHVFVGARLASECALYPGRDVTIRMKPFDTPAIDMTGTGLF